MNKTLWISFLVLFAFCSAVQNSYAEYDSAKELIDAGVKSYKKEGAKAAILAWLKGSALEGSKEALSQANMLRQVEDFYGSFLDYDIIKINDLSKRSKIYCLSINYQKGPLYCRFQVYQNVNNKWISTEFKFHTEAKMIFSDNLVFGE